MSQLHSCIEGNFIILNSCDTKPWYRDFPKYRQPDTYSSISLFMLRPFHRMRPILSGLVIPWLWDRPPSLCHVLDKCTVDKYLFSRPLWVTSGQSFGSQICPESHGLGLGSETSYCYIWKEMSSLYFGFAVSCPYEAGVPEFDTQPFPPDSWEVYPAQRIWIINKSPRSTFRHSKLLQILSPCVLSASPHPLLLLTTPRPPAVSPRPDTHGDRIWSSFTMESLAWASVINSYSLTLHQFWDSSFQWIEHIKAKIQWRHLFTDLTISPLWLGLGCTTHIRFKANMKWIFIRFEANKMGLFACVT
jgi:hypothetical protein